MLTLGLVQRRRDPSTDFSLLFFVALAKFNRKHALTKLKLILKRSKHCKNALHSLFWCELFQISFKSLTDPEGPGVLPGSVATLEG